MDSFINTSRAYEVQKPKWLNATVKNNSVTNNNMMEIMYKNTKWRTGMQAHL